MPPATPRSNEKNHQHLYLKFAAAATALSELYKESSDAYEDGFRDALLYVQQYLPDPASSPTTAASWAIHDRRPHTPLHPESTNSCVAPMVNAGRMREFLQNTIAQRRERLALMRGTASLRRRQREQDTATTEEEFAEEAEMGDGNAVSSRAAIGNMESIGHPPQPSCTTSYAPEQTTSVELMPLMGGDQATRSPPGALEQEMEQLGGLHDDGVEVLERRERRSLRHRRYVATDGFPVVRQRRHSPSECQPSRES